MTYLKSYGLKVAVMFLAQVVCLTSSPVFYNITILHPYWSYGVQSKRTIEQKVYMSM